MGSRQTPLPPADSDPVHSAGAWLRPGRHLFAGLGVLLMGLYFSINSAQLERQREISNRRSEVQRDLSNFRAKLETDIYACVAMAKGLGVNVVVQEGITEREFEKAALELLREERRLLSLSLAPGFVVRNVFPAEGNEAAIGLNLLDDAVQKHAVLRAISDDAPVLAGPFERVQGGSTLAVRVPLWVNRDGVPRLWGAVSVTLDYEQTMRDAGIRKLERDMRIRIVGRDASGPGGVLIRGEPLRDQAGAVKTPCCCPAAVGLSRPSRSKVGMRVRCGACPVSCSAWH
ncbi:CHASE domain-containing protein [Arenimonas daejeonensis]|uniref:CHASE domain-containing protein n=1 Tax=Arenimonas daejeonensis TaxID=370777 RepID=UPI0011BE8ADE|nr:CHASE domain-containing protein [Arenimonas daejeonensis]